MKSQSIAKPALHKHMQGTGGWRGKDRDHVLKLEAFGGVKGGPEVQHVGLEDDGLPSSEATLLPVCQGQHECPGAMRAVSMQLLQANIPPLMLLLLAPSFTAFCSQTCSASLGLCCLPAQGKHLVCRLYCLLHDQCYSLPSKTAGDRIIRYIPRCLPVREMRMPHAACACREHTGQTGLTCIQRPHVTRNKWA